MGLFWVLVYSWNVIIIVEFVDDDYFVRDGCVYGMLYLIVGIVDVCGLVGLL